MTNEKEPEKNEKPTEEKLTLEKLEKKLLARGNWVKKDLPKDQAFVFFKK